ncbi:UNVERIFIED_CONTAM: hypothetical protein PYX00_009430 [Menopon gallinae]|uniref:Chitin-binding type-2 domain-containing protein n=1 Tax=Menopon gallinae TaxID=328185 RepID=A0AAW2HB73_9NEOP
MSPLRMIAVLSVTVLATVLAVGFNPGNSTAGNSDDKNVSASGAPIIRSNGRRNSVLVYPMKFEGTSNLSRETSEEKVRRVRSNSTEPRIGAHLGIRMRDPDRAKGKRTTRTTMMGKHHSFGEASPTTGPSKREMIRNNRDQDPYRSGTVDARAYRYAGSDRSGLERYYSNDLDYVPNEENFFRVGQPNSPDNRLFRYRPDHRSVVENSACRKYLEFLRYAFEQLDDERSPLNHYANDRSSGQRPEGLTPFIVPNPELLRRLAVNSAAADANLKVLADKQYTTEAVRRMPVTRTISPRTTPPPTPTAKSTTAGATRQTLTKVPPMTDNAVIIKSADRGPVYRGYTTEKTTAKPEEVDAVEGDCHNKLFPCPDNVNATYPINGYCNRFVICEGGKPHPEFCQKGLHFNLVTRECDLPHKSFCTYSCPKANGYFGVPGDCGGFFRCSNWFPEYRMCPPRMHWDVRAKICVFRELSSCPLKCDSAYEVKPYSGVCNSYVICSRGEPSYHSCPYGAHFEREILRCVPQVRSNCTDDQNYIVRNRGLENGRKTLCAKVELDGSTSRWCQQTDEQEYKCTL